MKRQPNVAIVRQRVERLQGVSRTWFEWQSGEHGLENVLVVEVDFDTDPNASSHKRNVMDAIASTVETVLKEETTMAVSHLRIVPRTK